jgi:hypothetical protein
MTQIRYPWLRQNRGAFDFVATGPRAAGMRQSFTGQRDKRSNNPPSRRLGWDSLAFWVDLSKFDLERQKCGLCYTCFSKSGVMSRHFRLQNPDGRDIAPQEWLRLWVKLYPEKGYDHEEYKDLIASHNSLLADDFKRIGKWKDGAKAAGKWKPNVASVAYPIWLQAASEMPKCPEERRVADFLDDWSNRKYTDNFATGPVEKRFRLSRATTLLHFISGGRFPIFDSRVRQAIRRLLNLSYSVPNTISWYLESYCPLVQELADFCGAEDLRTLDKALFSYGRFSKSKGGH